MEAVELKGSNLSFLENPRFQSLSNGLGNTLQLNTYKKINQKTKFEIINTMGFFLKILLLQIQWQVPYNYIYVQTTITENQISIKHE